IGIIKLVNSVGLTIIVDGIERFSPEEFKNVAVNQVYLIYASHNSFQNDYGEYRIAKYNLKMADSEKSSIPLEV
ncbi:4242_t:CDS:1, partial [Gigaspora rosea]